MPEKSLQELVAEAKSQIKNLSPSDVKKEIDSGEATLIDIRESEEINEKGKIPGSVHAPRGMLEYYADPSSPFHMPEFDKEKELILHCAGGGRSALATKTLQEMGFKNVAHLEGGFKAWKDEGLPTE